MHEANAYRTIIKHQVSQDQLTCSIYPRVFPNNYINNKKSIRTGLTDTNQSIDMKLVVVVHTLLN